MKPTNAVYRANGSAPRSSMQYDPTGGCKRWIAVRHRLYIVLKMHVDLGRTIGALIHAATPDSRVRSGCESCS